VPAVAVIRDRLALSIITGCKTFDDCSKECLIYNVTKFVIWINNSVTRIFSKKIKLAN
jgi:hypothetical protein